MWRRGGEGCLVTGTWAWRGVLATIAIGPRSIPTNGRIVVDGDGKSSVGVEGVIFKLSLSRACQRGYHYLAFYHIVVELPSSPAANSQQRKRKRGGERERERERGREREREKGCRMQLLYEGIKKTIRGARKLRSERA